MKYLRRVLASIRKADELYGLFDNGDKILVGVSGGKDSLVLLKALSVYGKFRNKSFKIFPCTLDLGFEGFDVSKIKEFSTSLGYDLYVKDSREVYPILKENTKEGKHIPCSICSRMKKAAINAAAKELKCNKVAFAHHLDDALETLFMNMIHGARVATFEPKMYLERADITFIRPLMETKEEDIIGMAKEEKLPVMKKICPADGITEREYIKKFLNNIYKTKERSHENFSSMLSNYKPFMLNFRRLELNNGKMGSFALKPLIEVEDLLSYLKLAKTKGFKEPKKGHEHLLLLKKHKVAGLISFTRDNPHQISITSFEADEKIEDKAKILSFFFDLEIRETNPIYFLFKSKGKPLARKLGFKLGALPTNKKAYAIKVSQPSKR